MRRLSVLESATGCRLRTLAKVSATGRRVPALRHASSKPPTYGLSNRRFVACIVSGFALLAALESGLHIHPAGRVDGLFGQAHSVPLSIVLGADAPCPEQHWHAARIIESEWCTACLLSRHAASAPQGVPQVATSAADVVATPPANGPSRTFAPTSDSRAPPGLATS
jgi:hypothetical protein